MSSKIKTMTVVSSKEFATHQRKYYQLAVNGRVAIKRGKNLFYLVHEPAKTQYPEQPVLEPDDDLRKAITADELIRRIHEDKRRNFATCV